ncbi:MAG: DUF1295 domain-containing protein, partial [Chitinivibrionales bacterium]|nr:DUF1295 domain-containing protein [Chitinivibrionales bacterium]
EQGVFWVFRCHDYPFRLNPCDAGYPSPHTMPLKEELRAQGNWLFRHRSHLPLLILLLLPVAICELDAGRYLFRWLPWWQFLSLGVSLLGLLVRAVAVAGAARGTSGRNTRGQKADNLNTTGLYACVRHPLYVGNYLLFLGVTLLTGVWWFVIVGSLLYWLYYERIMYAEEEFLRDKYGDSFVQWASRTPAFLPALGRWTAPPAVSVKRVLKNEYTSVLGLAASFAAVDTLIVSLTTEQFAYSLFAAAVLGVGAVQYVVLRVLRKYTRVLH